MFVKECEQKMKKINPASEITYFSAEILPNLPKFSNWLSRSIWIPQIWSFTVPLFKDRNTYLGCQNHLLL